MDRQERMKVMEQMYQDHFTAGCIECAKKYPFGACEDIATEIMDQMAEIEVEDSFQK
jgi:hypothetical protein